MKNFLQAHVGIIQLLDYAKELGILQNVKDESGYWDHRDVEALVKTVGEWNVMIAASYGQFRDAVEAAGAEQSQMSTFPRVRLVVVSPAISLPIAKVP